MLTPHRSSWKEKRDRITRTDFVGRHEQLTSFRASVANPDPETLIFAISGQGGVGKTTLLKQFRQIATEAGHIAAYVDEGSATNRVEDVPEALYRLAKDFEAQNASYKFEKFQERYKTYRQKRQELEADPEAPSELAAGLGRAGTKVALGGVKAIPGVGDAMEEFVNSDAVAEKVGDWVSFAWKKFSNKDEVQLVTEPLEVLTPLFLDEINRIAERQTVVLLLDTYEITGKFLDDWLLAVLNDRYGDDLTGNFRLCIAGRDSLDRNAWATLESCIARSPLEPFTEDETRLFLYNKGIISEAVIAQIWKLSSGGLPLLVSMMAQNAPTNPDAVVDPCEDAVERFLKWETDDSKRQFAQDAAVPRVLNKDVVDELGDGQFEWLKGCAFVVRDGERWRYHLVVREQMVRYQFQKSSKRWDEVHGKLAAYYDQKRQGLRLEAGKEAKDACWREWTLEWLYHNLCITPQAKLDVALNGFLTALKTSREFAQDWATVMSQSGQEAKCTTLEQWGKRLCDSMIAQKEERYEKAISALTSLLEEVVVENSLKAVVFFQRGLSYFLSNQAESALKDIQQAVDINAKDLKSWIFLGLIHLYLKHYEEAITSYQQAIATNPNFAYLHNNLGNVYYEQKRYDEAIASYQQAITLDPNNAEYHNGLGRVYCDQKLHEKAITSYQQAIALDPNNAEYHNGLGRVYCDQKRYEEAIASYQQAIALDPNDSECHNGLGNVYYDQKRYEEAIAFYQQAINLDPQNTTPYKNLGIVYCSQKRYEEAITSYQQAIELDPKDASPHNGLGNVYREQKRYEEAIASYQQAIELDPNNASRHNNLGDIYSDQKRYEEAIASYQQAIAIDSNLAYPHNNLGLLYEEQERYEEAITSYQKAIELDPTYLRAQENLGYLQYYLGDYKASLHSHQKALELQPDNLTFSSNLGYLHLLQGNIDKAQEFIDRAIKDPTFDRVWLNLGLIQALRGQLEAAKQSWQKGLSLMEDDSNWEKAVRYVFTIALGNPTVGLEQMQNLINSGTDQFTLRNALNDATILSRTQQPIEGIEPILALLQTALDSMELGNSI